MAQRLPPLSALRAFAAAGRHLSFQRAAAELSVTPTAISHQIKRLEEDLGVELFRRLTRKLQLTEAGRSLLPEVASAFDKLATAVERLKASGDSGTLTISALITLAYRWLAPRLPKFQARHPQIDVRLEASQRLVDFARDEIDVGIRHGNGHWTGLTAIKLFDDRFTPLISPKLLEKGPPLKTPEDLVGYRLLRDSPYFEWEDWFTAAGATAPPEARGHRFDSSQLAVQAAEGGLGVALVHPDFFAEELDSGRLVQPFPIIAENGKAYYIVYPPAAADRPKVAAFREWLLAEAAEFREEMAKRVQAKRRSAAR
jgi:LysR family transcriptional regulator, glycine cleavage system transcriptional activator